MRPAKDCDLVLTRRGELLAVLEFKRATDPSFGNNFNNRTEVAIGSFTDIRTAVEKGVYGRQEHFFLGGASWLKLHLSRIRRSGCRVRISTLMVSLKVQVIWTATRSSAGDLNRKAATRQQQLSPARKKKARPGAPTATWQKIRALSALDLSSSRSW
ncbi:hypothetical protein DDA93_15750 [Arthrobacter sp. Bz4]|nr:hypothetical protein DDA93_15750 [Arthrobacter sp. Bz4]